MSDLISRQAAIDAVLHHGEIENNYTDLYHDGYCDGVYDSADMLKDLPPAEPRIIRCKDCKHWTDVNCGLCNIWNYYISNKEFFCGCGERREADDH